VDRASDSDSESQGFDSLHAYYSIERFGAVLVSTFKFNYYMNQVEVCNLRKKNTNLK
jgi:hypothetical protein